MTSELQKKIMRLAGLQGVGSAVWNELIEDVRQLEHELVECEMQINELQYLNRKMNGFVDDIVALRGRLNK